MIRFENGVSREELHPIFQVCTVDAVLKVSLITLTNRAYSVNNML